MPMVSLCSPHQDASNDMHIDLEVTLRSRGLRSTFELDLVRSSYTFFDAYRGEKLDGTAIFVLAWLVQKLLAKNSLVLSASILTFLTPVTSFLT